ncbi:hypothetical protein PCIT_a2201 [Pseudoalteromonas citrea]|uniref:Uncharacterized protein n=3 Tax=Pseudoalteromonas citrea TaxID=43655 RepID=A0AAD4AJD8_9GAMM|nr:hypothetical protein PCIT_a2201 [Pseudoalteromonas citrea]
MNISKEQQGALCSALAQLRLKADLTLAPKYPHFAGKPYPLGRCKEIRDEMYSLLMQHQSYTEFPILNILKTAQQQRPELQKVWGSLRDEFFQNAMVIDQWYIDVANDTVDANKPRVEIVPFAQSGFSQITSFKQFAHIARPYWQVELYRNEVCPALAPFLPIICVGKNQTSWLAAANDEMLKVAMHSEFKSAQEIIELLPSPPAHITNKWQTVLDKYAHIGLLKQTGSARDFCQKYRIEQRHLDSAFRDEIVIAYTHLPKGI